MKQREQAYRMGRILNFPFGALLCEHILINGVLGLDRNIEAGIGRSACRARWNCWC
jgi:hypothetical protein